jgi:uncharacterized membrane protein
MTFVTGPRFTGAATIAGMAERIAFRNRGREVSRLEAFSDVIFGFAVTLLVVSLEAPKSYGELMEMMHGFLPFAICFFIFIDIWWEHHDFFKRYAMHDNKMVGVLNTLLLFVVLFYVYPMKFMFTLALNMMSGHRMGISFSAGRTLFTLYGLGVLAVFGLLALLYVVAWRKRDTLQLNELERIDTKESIYDNLAMASFGLISLILANAGLIAFAGLIYYLIAIPKSVIPTVMGGKRRRAQERMEAAARGMEGDGVEMTA